MTNEKKVVDIIIPSWFMKEGHGGRYSKQCETFYIAAECLNRLLEVTPRELFNLIIINNGSDLKDEDVKDIEHIKFTPSWYWSQADILIRNTKNLGFAKAVNQGMNLARGELVMQMNNDILLYNEDWLDIMINDFEEAKDFSKPIGLLMPALEKSRIRFPDILNLKKEDIDMPNKGKFGAIAEFGSMWLGEKNMFMKIAENRDGYQVLDENFKLFKDDRWLYREMRMLGKESWRTHNLRVGHVGNLSVSKRKDKRKAIDESTEYFEKLKQEHGVN